MNAVHPAQARTEPVPERVQVQETPRRIVLFDSSLPGLLARLSKQ
jgi:hypothetical protein